MIKAFLAALAQNNQGGISGATVTKTGNYTATSSDFLILVDATAGNLVITTPQNAGQVLNVKKIDASANTVTITPASGQIDGAATKVISTQYTNVQFESNGVNSWIL